MSDPRNVFWNNDNQPGAAGGTKRPEAKYHPITKYMRVTSQRPSIGIGPVSDKMSPLDTISNNNRPVQSQRQPVGNNLVSSVLGMITTKPSQQPPKIANPLAVSNFNAQCSNGMRKQVTELPQKFRCIFPFINFNQVQSVVYDTIINTNKPVIISAPTGSGKTGVFELAVVKLIMDTDKNPALTGSWKVVYLAPTKALCSERRADWDKKFSPFNIQCLELTSDVSTPVNFKNITKSSILVATPEKWDSITRSWNGNKAFIQTIRLVLIDEVHLISDGSRGATLEAVISRMKTMQTIMWSSEPEKIRFVAASATVSNVDDLGQWFSAPNLESEIFKISAKDRPVKLKTIVMGYTTSANANEFSFDNLLNHKLADVIKQYSNSKPSLIFCATRRSATSAATVLMKEGQFDLSFSIDKRKLYLALSQQIKDKTLQETTRFGIAFHHAGLTAGDRKLIELGFTTGSVMVLCCTSTLALGVNLPAHLVVVKNTMYYDEGRFKPYGESTLVQMIGRAGRPQFDTEATAFIMTKTHCRDDIEKMLVGQLVVDSKLHKFLTEHLNSEIVLGTITDDVIARKWIDSTFLHVRLCRAPENYGLEAKSSKSLIEKTIIKWCTDSLEILLEHGMVKRTKQDFLESTHAGRAMARHYVSLDTAMKLVHLTGTESLADLIKLICSSYEITSDIQLRMDERSHLNAINNADEENLKLRFPINTEINTKEKKAAILIQATFGNRTISDITIFQESLRIVKNATRIVSCLRDIVLESNTSFNLLRNVLILSQCFASKLWENSVFVSKQLERIGAVLSHNLADSGLTSFQLLRNANPRNIEIICNRLPPFGSNVQQTCFGLPIYELKITFRKIPGVRDKIQLMVEVIMTNGLDVRSNHSLPKSHECFVLVGCKDSDKLLLKSVVMDAQLLARPDVTICLGSDIDILEAPKAGETVEAQLISEMFVGLDAKSAVVYWEPEEPY